MRGKKKKKVTNQQAVAGTAGTSTYLPAPIPIPAPVSVERGKVGRYLTLADGQEEGGRPDPVQLAE